MLPIRYCLLLVACCSLLACGPTLPERNQAALARLSERVGKLQDELTQLQEALRGNAKPSKSVARNSVRTIGARVKAFRVDLGSDGAISVNGTPVTMETLRGFATQLAQQEPNRPITITATKLVPQARVVEVTDELRDAGLKKIKLVVR